MPVLSSKIILLKKAGLYTKLGMVSVFAGKLVIMSMKEKSFLLISFIIRFLRGMG